MLTILIIYLCIGNMIHAGSISSSVVTSANPPSTLFVIDDELTKLATSCITYKDHEELSGHIVRWRLAFTFNLLLIKEADYMIGVEELRAVLGFGPPGNWTKHGEPPSEPSEAELAAAPTLESYFELREPWSIFRGLDNDYFFEYNYPPVIAFLDKRFPSIRKIFRHKFEEVLRRYAGKAIDRKTVDHLIEEFLIIRNRVNGAMDEMNTRTYECEHARKSHRSV